jgi:hypothetical protein
MDVFVNEMVKQVAKALANRRYVHTGGADAQTLVPGTPNWSFCIDDARIAISAMREPTPAMIKAGSAFAYEGWGDCETVATEAWQANIDAALR